MHLLRCELILSHHRGQSTPVSHPLQVLVALGEDIQAKQHLLPLKHHRLLKTIESGRTAYLVLLPVALVVLTVLTYTLLIHPPSDKYLIAASVRSTTSVNEGLTAFTLRKALPPSAELDEMIANGEYVDFGYLMVVTVFASPVAQVSRPLNLENISLLDSSILTIHSVT